MDTIYLIRHAERPSDAKEDEPPPPGPPVYAFNAGGVQDNKSLTARGWTRSGTWAVYFRTAVPTPPAQIFASAPDKVKVGHGVKDGSHSQRPMETVQATADRLGCPFDAKSYLKGDEDSLVEALQQQNGVTLVAWQHERIPYIASKLCPENNAVPTAWPGDRFDVIFKFTRGDGGSAWEFDQICPQLLQGDPADPIPVTPVP